MKVLDESGEGVQAGEPIGVEELGLPFRGGGAKLIVFWKRL